MWQEIKVCGDEVTVDFRLNCQEHGREARDYGSKVGAERMVSGCEDGGDGGILQGHRSDNNIMRSFDSWSITATVSKNLLASSAVPKTTSPKSAIGPRATHNRLHGTFFRRGLYFKLHVDLARTLRFGSQDFSMRSRSNPDDSSSNSTKTPARPPHPKSLWLHFPPFGLLLLLQLLESLSLRLPLP